MPAHEVDTAVVQRRLVLINELLDDLAAVESGAAERLDDDRMFRHAVERILTQLVDLAVAVNAHVTAALTGRAPEDNRSSFVAMAGVGVLDNDLAARMSLSVGMRNILIHGYTAVDLGIVARAIPVAVHEYRDYCGQVASWLDR